MTNVSDYLRNIVLMPDEQINDLTAAELLVFNGQFFNWLTIQGKPKLLLLVFG
jgi:hypothetical protein